MRAVIGPMKNSRRCDLQSLASIAATAALADRFVYSTSKGAVMAMTLSVAKDYLRHNIRCNCISPARIHTPFVDGFLAKNYPGREQEMYQKLAEAQPIWPAWGVPTRWRSLRCSYVPMTLPAFITGSSRLSHRRRLLQLAIAVMRIDSLPSTFLDLRSWRDTWIDDRMALLKRDFAPADLFRAGTSLRIKSMERPQYRPINPSAKKTAFLTSISLLTTSSSKRSGRLGGPSRAPSSRTPPAFFKLP